MSSAAAACRAQRLQQSTLHARICLCQQPTSWLATACQLAGPSSQDADSSSGCRYVGDRFLRKRVVSHHTSEQSVEWLYAFDVHCNSFMPMFVLLYGALFSPLFSSTPWCFDDRL
jgi:UNC-50 family